MNLTIVKGWLSSALKKRILDIQERSNDPEDYTLSAAFSADMSFRQDLRKELVRLVSFDSQRGVEAVNAKIADKHQQRDEKGIGLDLEHYGKIGEARPSVTINREIASGAIGY